mmetsp:Transcript_35502/g.66265  ORF Transcript_35502/g.66265 Transcript_35502/m.66265 type:complete len:777 (-) Transcript_35502:146-2476(-)
MSSSDLAIRETILGILKVKDVQNEGKIHTSDFRSAVSDLGYPFGHPIIENVLVHCVISVDGFVHYSGLEKQLQRERRLLGKSLGAAIPRGKTSTGVTEKPFRSDARHDQRVVVEKQTKLLQERHNDVYDGYRKYQEEEINEKQFIEYIESMGITATPNFLHLLRTHRYTDFSFADFMKSLSKYDPNCQEFNSDQPAGGAASYMGAIENKNREECAAGLFYARKRLDYKKKDDIRRSVFDKTDAKSRKKLYVKGDEGGISTLQSKVQSSDDIAKAFQYESCASAQQMYSVAHDSMITGGHQGKQPINTSIGYNSEQKMLREQVLAALRKLELGEITPVEFEDLIYQMGIEFPEVLVKHLRQNQSTGLLDWTLCVRSLDSHVFKSKLMTEQPDLEEVKNIKSRLLLALRELNTTCPLQYLLKKLMSESSGGTKAVSFGEFRKAVRDIVKDTSMVSDDDLRKLFNASDTSGDGRLSADEFTSGMHVVEVTPCRKDIVRQAFFTIDRHEDKMITLSAFMDFFNVNFHPDVKRGLKSEWVVLADVEDYFLATADDANGFDTNISYEAFEAFVLSMSGFCETDEEFIALVRHLFTFTELKPPPPQYKMSHGHKDNPTPTAKQVFGDFISWNQTESAKEKGQSVRVTKTKIDCPYKDSDFMGWNKKDAQVDVPIEVSQYKISRTNKAAGSSDLLEWKAPSGANAKSRALTNWKPSGTSTKIKVVEGSSPPTAFSKTNYQWSKTKREQYSGGCPFGRNETPADENKRQNELKPRSLADILGKEK